MASEARFSEFEKLATKAGYQLARIRGSHHIFEKHGQPILSIPVHRGKVKSFYVRQIKKLSERQGD